MTVAIVTDSLSDITSDLAKKLDITVVPLTVLFGHETFLDRVTITTDEFYRRLAQGDVWPTTTQPPPVTFAETYDKLAEHNNEILVVTVSSKLSGTYQSALGAKNLMKKKARVEVIDSQLVIMGLGLIVIAVARMAKEGGKLSDLANFVRQAMLRSHPLMYFDTLKYLAKGGRIGKAQSLLGSMLSVKPLLTMKDGEVAPVTRVRSRVAGMDYLYNYVAGFASRIDELAVEHATSPDDCQELINRLGKFFPKERIYTSTVSPVIGVYAGPNIMTVSVLESAKK